MQNQRICNDPDRPFSVKIESFPDPLVAFLWGWIRELRGAA